MSKLQDFRWPLSLSLLLGMAAFSLFAQNGSSDKGPARFKTSVDQVVVYAAVYDESGQLVADLKESDFRIFEDKLQQEVTYFALEDIPTSIGVVMDKSGSMRSKQDLVNQSTKLFLENNNPQNELFLIAFDDEVEMEETFTRDIEDIRDALDNIIVSGGTALYDAIYLALDKVAEGSEGKKALLVFTDGEDKDSYYTAEELLERAREAEVQIFLVAFLDEDLEDESGFFGVFKSEREKVTTTLNRISEETGGRAYFPSEARELNTVFKGIAYELRNQYRLAYASSNPVRDGKWRRVRVEVVDAKSKKLKVRARKGYYAN